MADPARPFPRIAEGAFVLYRLYDVAEEIDLARAEALLAGEAARLRLTGERKGFLDLPDRPLTIALGCTGGRHRSVALANEIGRALGTDRSVVVSHRDVERVGT